MTGDHNAHLMALHGQPFGYVVENRKSEHSGFLRNTQNGWRSRRRPYNRWIWVWALIVVLVCLIVRFEETNNSRHRRSIRPDFQSYMLWEFGEDVELFAIVGVASGLKFRAGLVWRPCVQGHMAGRVVDARFG
jgi:hypothetical protein